MMNEHVKNIPGEAPEEKTGGVADGMEENRLSGDDLEKVAGGRGKAILEKVFYAASDDQPKEKRFQWNGKR